jgi:hypothetical protein
MVEYRNEGRIEQRFSFSQRMIYTRNEDADHPLLGRNPLRPKRKIERS